MAQSLKTGVQAEALLKELAAVWAELGKEQKGAGGVLRACSLTMVAIVEREADIGETLADIMRDQPCRFIVVRLGEANRISAHATAECWMPFGRRQQICCERIEIAASLDTLGDVPSVLRGLLVPDLPVVLWIRDPRALRHPSADEFLAIAQKIVVDPRGFDDWKWLSEEVRRLAAAGVPIADLAWTRITRWRELIARLFDDPASLAALSSLDEIEIHHSSPEPGPAARYLAAWIRICLGRELRVAYLQANHTETWQIQHVVLRGPGIEYRIRRAERGMVTVEGPGIANRVVFRLLKESELLREELRIPGRDEVFGRVVLAA